MGQAES